MSTATRTDTEVLEQINNQEPIPCQIQNAFYSTTTWKFLRAGDRCPNPAEYTTMLHSLSDHEDTHTDMCGDCYRHFIGRKCPDPKCQAPRLTSSRPI